MRFARPSRFSTPARSILAASALLALAAPQPGCGGDDAGPVHAGAYSFDLPSGWNAKDSKDVSDSVAADVKDKLGEGYQFDVSKVYVSDRVDGFTTNVNVSSEKLPGGVGLAQYRDISIRNAPALGMTVDTDPVDTTLGGEPAFQIELLQKQGDKDIRSRIVVAIRDRVAYSVTLTAGDGQAFDDAEPDFDSMINSWSWTG